MGQAIGDFLPSAVGVAISPLPIVAVVLMLVTPRGRANGPLFVVGWWIGLALVGTIVLAVAGGINATSSSSGPATWVDILLLLLGLGLVLLSLKQWRGRPHGDDEPPTPKWMGALDAFTPVKAAGAGVVLSALNPKNLLLTVAGAAAIAQTGISTGSQIGAFIVFVAIASLGVAAPVVIYFALGDRSGPMLAKLKSWLTHNNAVIMATLLLIIGVKLIGEAISGLST
jgi:threonine/homoserine/homoserine lactone efflux protein